MLTARELLESCPSPILKVSVTQGNSLTHQQSEEVEGSKGDLRGNFGNKIKSKLNYIKFLSRIHFLGSKLSTTLRSD